MEEHFRIVVVIVGYCDILGLVEEALELVRKGKLLGTPVEHRFGV